MIPVNSITSIKTLLQAGYGVRNLSAPKSHKSIEVTVESLLIRDQILYVASKGCLFRYSLDTTDALQECVLQARPDQERDLEMTTEIVACEKEKFSQRFALINNRYSWCIRVAFILNA